MVANSIKKLIDEAIIPAFLLIVAKMAGILVASYFFNFSFDVKYGGMLPFLPTIKFFQVADYIKAENYSNLAMFTTAAIGTLIALVRLHFLHESHIAPKLQVKLAATKLEKIIAGSYQLYHTAATWLIFLWLTTAFLAVSTIFKVTYMHITILALFIAVNFTWILALDIEKELKIKDL